MDWKAEANFWRSLATDMKECLDEMIWDLDRAYQKGTYGKRLIEKWNRKNGR